MIDLFINTAILQTSEGTAPSIKDLEAVRTGKDVIEIDQVKPNHKVAISALKVEEGGGYSVARSSKEYDLPIRR